MNYKKQSTLLPIIYHAKYMKYKKQSTLLPIIYYKTRKNPSSLRSYKIYTNKLAKLYQPPQNTKNIKIL